MTAYYDERQLITEIKKGSRDAFEMLLDRYEGKVYNLVRRTVGPLDAEDVAQEALIAVCKSIASFKGMSSLSTWVYRVSMNICLEHRRRKRPEIISFEEDFAERESNHSESLVDSVVQSELKRDINSALKELPDIHRDVVVLHELHGLTYQECAEVLGCPVGTVKSRLSNAFVKLRELLKDHAPESRMTK